MDRWKRQVSEWKRGNVPEPIVDDFVLYDDTKIKWSRDLKKKLTRGVIAEYANEKIRTSLYRPFTKSNLYLDRTMTDRVSPIPSIFPTPETENENKVICVNSGSTKPFHALMVDVIPDLHFTGDSQCFPFYTYSQDGKIRRENITDWALKTFQNTYGDNNITKWDIFYYTYGILYHPDYRAKYQENLKRNFPRIPFANDFWAFLKAGKQLADLHINYESMPKYAGLKFKETPDMPLDWRVEKMTLSKDKTQIRYNDFLTIENIPTDAHDYRLGTRSALEWIVDQYSVTEDYNPKTGRGSRIVNDPNREADPQYIVDLIGRIVTVSLETVKLVASLPAL